MKKEYLYLLVSILAGALIGVFISSNVVNSNNMGMMRMMGMNTQSMQQSKNQGMMQMHEMMNDDDMSMSGMVEALKDKTGEDFDKEFVSQMIVHHQGAIDMAKLVEQNAFHKEIKDLANDIITAQTKEINMMREWQQTWGY